MKQKLFTLLTLLVLCMTGVWADDVNTTFNFDNGSTDGLSIVKSGTAANVSYSVTNQTYNQIPTLSDGNYFLGVNFTNNSAGVLDVTTTSSFANIKTISFDCAADNNSNPKIAIYIVDDENQETLVQSAMVLSSGSTKVWRSKKSGVSIYSLDLSSSPKTGKVHFKFTTGSSGRSGAIDNIVITTEENDGKTPSTFALTIDGEVEVTGTSQITYENNAGTVTYKSANEAVATVSSTGEITAVAGGKTTITVTDPGSETVKPGSATVTVLVPYPNPTAADAYTLDNSQYAFSNSDNTKYYFKNGFAITNTASKAYGSANMGDAGTGMKFSANTAYTINVPSNVTVTYAVFTARNNYGSDKTAANWGTVFGTDYSATALPWSNETPADKDFVLDPAQTGGTLAFTPGGNQWQAIITLNTIAYHEKYAVSYAAGEGTGTMAGTAVRGGSKFNLPASTFTAPAEKGFAGWLCDIDNVVYAAGAEYTMTDANTAFTAQYEGIEGKTIIKVTLGGGTSATVSGAIGGTADVKVQSDKKFGSGHYAGFTLAGANTFKTGDIINVRITTASSGENTRIVIYDSDKSTVLYNTGTAGVVGDNKFALPSAVNNKATLYICRTGNSETDNGWNAYVDYIEVIRPNAVATLNASGYATYSAAADFTVTGAKAYKAALNTADNKITCTEVEAVPAGAGVLLFGEANAKVAIVNTTSAAALADNDLKGTTKADGSLVALDNTKFYYALSGDTFMKYSGTAFVANKAYFESATELSAKAFAIVFDGESTGINAIEEVAPVTKTRKVVKNGRLVIETANGEFTVSGARIK